MEGGPVEIYDLRLEAGRHYEALQCLECALLEITGDGELARTLKANLAFCKSMIGNYPAAIALYQEVRQAVGSQEKMKRMCD